ncbi:flagellar biosynthetic protein FliR [Sedimentitalea nanhaiensis]|uniref:Flagellar biosynthetic protein FliR n=1 Tax=Sedimentitalea nanhaiensis TaxID=999627 RepID=A0A1I7C7V7_9RHOB|nr:flagellar biosynthetic protein FliR [Sedimentitalea nanhaiensis]SFT95472.1 flagellar biosynthetic protein FliR [Sedimentitalea nanhaiensis]
MIALPQDVLSLLSAGLWHGITVFLRVSALVSVMPAFGERAVPMRVKLGVAIAFSLIILPAVPTLAPPTSPLAFSTFAITEVIVGLALGIGIRLFVLALQTAGSMAAQSTSLSQILGGAAVEPIPAMGYVLVVGGLALAVMAGLHVRAAELMIYSYQVFPAGGFPSGRELSSWGVGRVASAFSLAFLLAAPFVVTSVLYNLTLGVINRAMPQLMVAFVGAPVITLGGMVLLFLCAPYILTVWTDAMMSFLQDPMAPPR